MEYLTIAISVICALSAYIWNQQNNKIQDTEKQIVNLKKKYDPLFGLYADVREIKTDIKWIKNNKF